MPARFSSAAKFQTTREFYPERLAIESFVRLNAKATDQPGQKTNGSGPGRLVWKMAADVFFFVKVSLRTFVENSDCAGSAGGSFDLAGWGRVKSGPAQLWVRIDKTQVNAV